MTDKWGGGRWTVWGTAKNSSGIEIHKYGKATNGSYSSFEATVHAAVMAGSTKIEIVKVIE